MDSKERTNKDAPRERMESMNLSVISGRICKDLEVRYSQSQMAILKFNLAVDRAVKKDNGSTADFISCIAFGKTAETMGKYLGKEKVS